MYVFMGFWDALYLCKENVGSLTIMATISQTLTLSVAKQFALF